MALKYSIVLKEIKEIDSQEAVCIPMGMTTTEFLSRKYPRKTVFQGDRESLRLELSFINLDTNLSSIDYTDLGKQLDNMFSGKPIKESDTMNQCRCFIDTYVEDLFHKSKLLNVESSESTNSIKGEKICIWNILEADRINATLDISYSPI